MRDKEEYKSIFKKLTGDAEDDLYFTHILIVGRSVAMVEFAVSGFHSIQSFRNGVEPQVWQHKPSERTHSEWQTTWSNCVFILVYLTNAHVVMLIL